VPFAAIERLTEAATRSGCEIEWSPPEGGTIRVRPASSVTEAAPVAATVPAPITAEVRERSLEAMAAERDRLQYGASRFGAGALPMGARR